MVDRGRRGDLEPCSLARRSTSSASAQVKDAAGDSGLGERDEAHVALEHDGLGRRRHAGEAEPGGEFALVHHAFADDIGVFGVVHDERVEIARIGQRAAHHLRIGDALRAVGESDGAGRLEQADLGHLLARAAPWSAPPSAARGRSRCRARGAGRSRRCAGSSITGEVSGWHTMVVTPPAAAAWLADAMVSRYSAPGSPTKARMSMSPGATSLPLQSMTSVPPARRPRRCRAWPRGSRRRR